MPTEDTTYHANITQNTHRETDTHGNKASIKEQHHCKMLEHQWLILKVWCPQ